MPGMSFALVIGTSALSSNADPFSLDGRTSSPGVMETLGELCKQVRSLERNEGAAA